MMMSCRKKEKKKRKSQKGFQQADSEKKKKKKKVTVHSCLYPAGTRAGSAVRQHYTLHLCTTLGFFVQGGENRLTSLKVNNCGMISGNQSESRV